jgi:PEP-CTERM motif
VGNAGLSGYGCYRVVGTTAPGDLRGGRYVANVVSLDIQASAATAPSIGGGISSSFSVSGDALRPMTFDLAGLLALPTRTTTLGTSVFTGVSFWDLQGLGSSGFARLVVANDVSRGRYVSNLTALEVYHAVAAVPEPQTWALFGVGLLALLALARRRRPMH